MAEVVYAEYHNIFPDYMTLNATYIGILERKFQNMASP